MKHVKTKLAALLMALSVCSMVGTSLALENAAREIEKTNRIGVVDETPSYTTTLKASAKVYTMPPFIKSKPVVSLKKGETVVIFSESKGWSDPDHVQILYNDALAHIKKSCLEITMDGSVKKSELLDGAFFIQPTANVAIYKQANTRSKRLSTSPKGIILAAVGESDGFYQVVWGNSTGYIDKSQAALYNTNRFDIKLIIDKTEYAVNEKIDIKATLEYVGSCDEITVWHGDPCMLITVSNDKGTLCGGMVLDILTCSTFKKGEIYSFNFFKSGAYSEDAPDAAFWREFFNEPDLYLPKGEYTVAAYLDASLSDAVADSHIGPVTEKKIVVK